MTHTRDAEPDWLHGHAHEPNLIVPPGDGSFVLITGAHQRLFTPASLLAFPQTLVEHCSIVSTGHGVSGPFAFGGVRLLDLLALSRSELGFPYLDVIGLDGFGVRLSRDEIESAPSARPPLLALRVDGNALTRGHGLVRLIVPTEQNDALKQIKWLARVVIGES